MIENDGPATDMKQGLTGWKLGHLILRDYFDEQKEALFTDQAMALLKKGLYDPADVDEYNRLVRVYQSSGPANSSEQRLSLETRLTLIMGLEVTMILRYLTSILKKAPLPEAVAVSEENPEIKLVTEKQFEDLRREQHNHLLQEHYRLSWVIASRAYELAPEALKTEHTDIDQIEEVRPELARELWMRAWKQIGALVEQGVLRAVGGSSSDTSISFDEADSERLRQSLNETFVSGEDLYGSGIPEWKRWVEEFKPGWPYGRPSDKVVVVQNPDPDQVDEKGYFKDSDTSREHSFLKYLERTYAAQDERAVEVLNQIFARFTQQATSFLGYYVLIESAVGEAELGEMAGHLQETWARLEREIAAYNRALAVARQWEPGLLSPLSLQGLQPDKDRLASLTRDLRLST